MTGNKIPKWLKWAREIQAISQIGLAFAHNEYDRERNTRLAELATEILEEYADVGAESKASFVNQIGYATPKIDVRGAVLRDGKILLVKEQTDGRWCMPGGWADVGDSPASAVEREVWEESGFNVQTRKVIAVYDANRSGRPLSLYHAFKVIFLCEIISGEATPSHETPDVGFFEFDQLPDLSENRTHERHLDEIRKHLKNPDRATAFD
ncbi:MAG: NUDIX hydrolase [candidate division KSB1 bacterium]|nr:NUDIX hydrolase [candidate division KSB1 bacterium]